MPWTVGPGAAHHGTVEGEGWRVPANRYWDLEQCRWVAYVPLVPDSSGSGPALPGMRSGVEPPVASVAEEVGDTPPNPVGATWSDTLPG